MELGSNNGAHLDFHFNAEGLNPIHPHAVFGGLK